MKGIPNANAGEIGIIYEDDDGTKDDENSEHNARYFEHDDDGRVEGIKEVKSGMDPQIKVKDAKENGADRATDVITVELDVENQIAETNRTVEMELTDSLRPLDKDMTSKNKNLSSEKKTAQNEEDNARNVVNDDDGGFEGIKETNGAQHAIPLDDHVDAQNDNNCQSETNLQDTSGDVGSVGGDDEYANEQIAALDVCESIMNTADQSSNPTGTGARTTLTYLGVPERECQTTLSQAGMRVVVEYMKREFD